MMLVLYMYRCSCCTCHYIMLIVTNNVDIINKNTHIYYFAVASYFTFTKTKYLVQENQGSLQVCVSTPNLPQTSQPLVEITIINGSAIG